MREKAQPVVTKYTEQVGEPLVKEFYAELDKARQQNKPVVFPDLSPRG